MLMLMLALMASTTIEARIIKIHGRVTMQGSEDGAPGVTIFNGETNKLLGMTDEEGKYSVTADSEGSLIFSGLSYQEIQVPVEGRLIIDVAISNAANELDEVVVEAKSRGNTLMAEPTVIEIEGNMAKFKQKLKLPMKLFSSSKRCIIQPIVMNVTRNNVTYLNPLVYDGVRYAITQRRLYDRPNKSDTLLAYERILRSGSKKDDGTVFFRDSLYVDNPNDDLLLALVSSLENYNSILYVDTIETARGTINPLRFLEMNFEPMTMNEEEFLPSEHVELRDADGQVNLLFPVGKTELDLSLGDNATELDKMLQELRVIENDPSMTLKSFHIKGYASPEGREASNRALAAKRMQSALSIIRNSVDASLTRNAEISSDAEIAPWEDVVKMMRADSLPEEADAVQGIIDRYSTLDAQGIAMKRLPFYSLLIKDTYLPRLRKVDYHIVSSCYRPLTDAEISELYQSNPNSLNRYHFYRYYSVRSGEEREEALRRAVAAHPDFAVAAADLSAIMIEKGENPMELLEPFMIKSNRTKQKIPTAIPYNMALACLQNNAYARADSILQTLPESEANHKAKMYGRALNGHYRDVMEELCEDSPLNEVLILLTMKENHSAARSAKALGNSAVEEYVKAIVANRIDDYLSAEAHLKTAISLDPSLLNIAKVDADVRDLLEYVLVEEDVAPDQTEEEPQQ